MMTQRTPFTNRKGMALALALAVMASPAMTGLAAAATPEEQVKARQDTMKGLAGAMKKVLSFVKGEGATLADVAAAAGLVHATASRLPDLFPAGTAVGVAKSAAKPEIWQQKDQFRQKVSALETASAAFVLAAASGDAATIKAAVPVLGKACSGCHEDFRLKVE